MLFNCGHESLTGIDGLCVPCYNKRQSKSPKQKRKEWEAKNRIKRKKYNRDLARKKNGTIIGKFVVVHEGRFKRAIQPPQYLWGRFNQAHVYGSVGYARLAVDSLGYGVIMRLMKSEACTIANYKANGLDGV